MIPSDPRALRTASGAFLTGVTAVKSPNERLMSANSLTTAPVSLSSVFEDALTTVAKIGGFGIYHQNQNSGDVRAFV